MWDDPARARQVTQEATRLRRVVESYASLAGDVEGLDELLELADEEEAAELEEERVRIERDLETLYREALFVDKHDDAAAIVTVKPGASSSVVVTLTV